MAGHFIIANPALQVCRVICVVGLVLAATVARPTAAEAAPRTLAVADPDTDGDGPSDELGRAVSFLVRSALSTDRIRLVPRRELALGLEALGGKRHGSGLTLTADVAPKLLERMRADAVVVWRLDVDAKGTTVRGTMLGAGGKRLLRIHEAGATGDIVELARTLAARVAAAAEGDASDLADVGLADVRPFLAVDAALLAGDSTAAARAVEVASPAVAGKVAEAKSTLELLAADPGITALPRGQAQLLRSDWPAALALADRALSSEPKSAALRAMKIRALVASKNFSAAEAELALLRGTLNAPALAVAGLALALGRDTSLEERDAALAPLRGRPAGEWRGVLAMIAATPPGTFGAKTEAAVLAAAEKLLAQEPGLAATLAARALAVGGSSRDAAQLIHVRELSAQQIAAVRLRLEAESDAASVELASQIHRREEDAKAIAAEAGPEPPTGPPSLLSRNLKPILQALDTLYDPALSSIQVGTLPESGQPFYWPFLVRPHRVREGLIETLLRSPWDLKATPSKIDTELLPAERLSDEAIATLATELGAGALLLYRVRPASVAPWATLELVLYDPTRQRTEHVEATLVGRSTGIMILNPLVVVVGVLVAAALLAGLVVVSLRGTILVRVQWDADAKDELFSLLISRSPTTPTIANITAYRKRLEWLGERKRRFEAWSVQQNTTFRGIPRGRWYVHLYGIYTRGRQTMLLHEPPQEVQVLPRKTAFVAHVLEAAEAEFKIVVVDNHGPVEGARVWLDDDRAKAVTTAKAGMVSLKVAKGFHVIRVSAREMTVERPYHVVKAKVHDMTINLVWERRQEYVSRALERQVDDAAPYLGKAPRRQEAAAAELPREAFADSREAPDPMSSPMSSPMDLPMDLPVDLPAAEESAVPVDLPAPMVGPGTMNAADESVDLDIAVVMPPPMAKAERARVSLTPLQPLASGEPSKRPR